MGNQQARPIPEYPGYFATEDGRIFKGDVELRQYHYGKGYPRVSIKHSSGRNKVESVHRLVLDAFQPQPIGLKLQVNHKDGNKTNNHVSNLEWVTPSQNMIHARDVGLNPIGEKHPSARLTEKQVVEICQLLLETKLPLKRIAGLYGVTPTHIGYIVNKTRWSSVSDRFWKGKLHRLVERRKPQAGLKRGTPKGEDIVRTCAKVQEG